MATAFASELRNLRLGARLSQLELALHAGISQRHLSFLESARSAPGREVATKLAAALRLSPESANDLLAKAGFAPPFPPLPWSSASMAPLRAAAAHVLAGASPFPSVLMDVSGDLLDANPSFEAAIALIDAPEALFQRSHGDNPRNLYRLTLHPQGLSAALINRDEVFAATLQRMHAEAASSPRLSALLEEVKRWEGVRPEWLAPNWRSKPTPIVIERYRVNDAVVSVFAITTTLGAPMEVAAGGVRIESYFPADDASRALMTKALKP